MFKKKYVKTKATTTLPSLRKTLLFCLCRVGAYLTLSNLRDGSENAALAPSNQKPREGETTTTTKMRKLNSGWDEAGWKYYMDQKNLLLETEKTDPSRTIALVDKGATTVSTVINHNVGFWDKVNGHANWEAGTFRIFSKYVTAETIVVDFGTWIGPTILYHGQFSKHSHGIEADPVAFAVAEYNLELNRDKPWGNHVSVESACVSAPRHIGPMTMRGAKNPGMSMSGISDKLATSFAGSWQVQCYALDSILETWGVKLSAQPVMFKIDIESYECTLVPSFYEWLKDQPRLPTMFISFHPGIKDCEPEEWAGILKLFQLYEHVRAIGDEVPIKITPETTIEEFHAMKTHVHWRKDSSFVVSGKRAVVA